MTFFGQEALSWVREETISKLFGVKVEGGTVPRDRQGCVWLRETTHSRQTDRQTELICCSQKGQQASCPQCFLHEFSCQERRLGCTPGLCQMFRPDHPSRKSRKVWMLLVIHSSWEQELVLLDGVEGKALKFFLRINHYLCRALSPPLRQDQGIPSFHTPSAIPSCPDSAEQASA